MKHFTFFLFIVMNHCSFYSQSFNLTGQFCLGAINSDIPVKQSKLNNGNKILLTQSNSPASGDKTENGRGDYDIWIVCLDANEQIVWQKTIGGSNIDLPSDLLISSDQNIYIGGATKSPASFEQSNVLFGSWDAWLIKMNSAGNILWNKNYGGIASDGFNELIELTSGSIMAFGSSSSSNSGNKTSVSYGSTDVWCLKLDSDGSILNDWSIGGADIDKRPIVVQSSPNQLMLVCESLSNTSGLKSEDSYGVSDLWVIDLDTNCSIQQQKTIGGTDIDQVSDIVLSHDGSLLILAQSWSNQSGLKSEDSYGLMDTWLLKLTENLGIVRQKTIGGVAQDFGNRIYEWTNGNIIVAATSDSPQNPFKTEANIGLMDVWLYAVDSNFNLMADQTIGTPSDDIVVDFSIEPSTSNIHVLAYSNGSVQIDKECAGLGSFDIWGLNVNSTLNINAGYPNTDLGIFPNPTTQNLHITNNTGKPIRIELFDFSGKKISELNLYSENQIFDIGLLEKGMYWIRWSSSGKEKMEKIILLPN
jgi:hypothetical protein